MRISGVVALVGGGLLLLGAAWWVLREGPRTLPDAATPLRSAKPVAAGDAVPSFRASPEVRTTEGKLPQALEVPPRAATQDAGDAASRAPLDLTIVHADGTVADGAVVTLVCDGFPLGRRVTDALGRASFDSFGASAVIGIGGVSDVPLRLELSASIGEQRVVLPDGLSISGRVLVDGAPPKRPLLLGLSATEGKGNVRVQSRDWLEVFDSLWAEASGADWQRLYNAQLIGTDGRFEFSGLPQGWEGRFEVTLQHWGQDSDTALAVTAPANDVILELTSTRTIRGRVVGIGGAAPVPGALIQGEVVADMSTRSREFEADAEGRFSIPLAWYDDGFDRLTLRIRHPAGTGFREFTVTRTDAPPGDDLGDIELLPVRALAFVVRDAEGVPVPGALAIADDRSGLRSKPTDAAGLSSLDGLLHDTASMTVWAHRYFAQQVTLPPAASAPVVDAGGAHAGSRPAEPPIVVVLQRCPSLDVHVTLPDGSPAPAVNIVVSAAQGLFASAPRHGPRRSFVPDDTAFEVGMTNMRGAMSKPETGGGIEDTSGWVAFGPDRDGRASIADLQPAVPFELAVWSERGELAWGPQALSLAAGEARTVEAVIARAPGELIVSVRDERGVPIKGAGVDTTLNAHSTRSGSRTGADGMAVLTEVYAASVNVSVDKEGYADQLMEHVVVARGGSPLEVVLQAGLQVRVFVHDSKGRGVRTEWVAARQGERVLASGNEGPEEDRAHWVLAGLLPGDVTLVAKVGGRLFRQPHATTTPEAEIVVPDTGALQVRWDFALDEGHEHYFTVHAVGAPVDEWLIRRPSAKEVATREILVDVLVGGDYEVAFIPNWNPDARCSRTSVVIVRPDFTTELTLVAP